MSAEIQQAIIDVLIKKTIKAVKDYKANSLILGGGVSANSELRKQFADKLQKLKAHSNHKINLLIPPANLSTDNALMTAITGFYKNNKKIAKSDLTKIIADGNLRIRQ